MKNHQKWSGVKLSKKELDEIRKEEKLEIIVSILTFLGLIGLAFLLAAIVTMILGRL